MTGDYLPNADKAIVPERKIVDYLLSATHPDGQAKARFFLMYGFAFSEWQALAAALRRHAVEHAVTRATETSFGARYIVEGIIHSPDGRNPVVRTIWFIQRGAEIPTLVTAYPAKSREST